MLKLIRKRAAPHLRNTPCLIIVYFPFPKQPNNHLTYLENLVDWNVFSEEGKIQARQNKV